MPDLGWAGPGGGDTDVPSHYGVPALRRERGVLDLAWLGLAEKTILPAHRLQRSEE